MTWSTRLYCTIQQFCAFILIMGPFWYFSTSWMMAKHPGPHMSPGAFWDTTSMVLILFGLLTLLDDTCTWLNTEFKTGN